MLNDLSVMYDEMSGVAEPYDSYSYDSLDLSSIKTETQANGSKTNYEQARNLYNYTKEILDLLEKEKIKNIFKGEKNPVVWGEGPEKSLLVLHERALNEMNYYEPYYRASKRTRTNVDIIYVLLNYILVIIALSIVSGRMLGVIKKYISPTIKLSEKSSEYKAVFISMEAVLAMDVNDNKIVHLINPENIDIVIIQNEDYTCMDVLLLILRTLIYPLKPSLIQK